VDRMEAEREQDTLLSDVAPEPGNPPLPVPVPPNGQPPP
jgi:hypothetical protein